MIWKHTPTIEQLNERGKDTLTSLMGIIISEIGEDFLKGKMKVDERTIQPFKILHGGASAVLAETLGSVASNLCIDQDHVAVGLNLFVSHIKKGCLGEELEAICKANHIGKKTHIWNIDLFNKDKQLISKSTLTTTIIPKDKIK